MGHSTKRLLHIFPTFAVGGVSVRMATIMSHLGASYRHTVVALDGRYDCQSRLSDQVDVQLLRLPTMKDPLAARLLRIHRVLRETDPDAVLTYNWGAVEWAFVNRVLGSRPLVHLESGFGKEEAESLLGRRTLIRRLVLPGARFVVVPSHALVRIAQNIWSLDPRKVVHIPNGVDCAKFRVLAACGSVRQRDSNSREILIGTVAPLRPEKNLSRLIRAFAGISRRVSARLIIAGDGSEQPRLALLAHELGVAGHVVFAGHVEAVADVLASIDIFALSSDTEQMPNSVLQAMAAGRPVVAPDVGDIRLILSPANRPYVAPRGDEIAFQDLLERLATDPTLRKELGHANREHVKAHYTEDKMVTAYREVLDLACKG